MTIDEALAKLNEIKLQAKFGGDTNLVVCALESEIAYADQIEFRYESDIDGAVVAIDVRLDI